MQARATAGRESLEAKIKTSQVSYLVAAYLRFFLYTGPLCAWGASPGLQSWSDPTSCLADLAFIPSDPQTVNYYS